MARNHGKKSVDSQTAPGPAPCGDRDRHQKPSKRGQPGYTLTELLIVITLIAMVAVVAIPSMSSRQDATLEAATAEVVAAIRFAHSEALRTGESHGIHVDQPGQRIRVYRLDDSVNPATLHFDVNDPMTRQLYELKFGADAKISSLSLKFKGSDISGTYLGFSGGTGIPQHNDAGTIRLLENGYIKLGYKDALSTIEVAPMTSRVTVQ